MFSEIEPDYDDSIIESSGFWGSISVGEFQKTRTIPMQIPIEMVKTVLIHAMQALEIDLQDVEAKYRTEGWQTAAEVKGIIINGENIAQTSYKKAVFARAKADLLTEYSTINAREIHEGRDMVKEQKSLLSEATFAIRTLKEKKRGSVCLI